MNNDMILSPGLDKKLQLRCYLFLLVICPYFLNAQDLLRGTIVADSLMEASVHIINITQQTGTVNSASGSFELRVKENDTLWFTSLQYKKEEVIISAEIFQQKFFRIKLKEAINELSEVNISNINLTGNVETDLGNIPVFNKYNLGVPLRTKPLPTAEERRLYSASNAGALGFVINTLTGEIKKLKKEKEISELLRLVYKIEKLIEKTYFLEDLGMKDFEVSEFLYYCAEKDDLKSIVAGENILLLMEYFSTMLPRYRAYLNEQ
ncbi:hypothetical protein DHB64_09055 [Antarcticibacterium sp. W02-3]|nr:hypothetical protein [Antarcticibacterium sp. W02-3]